MKESNRVSPGEVEPLVVFASGSVLEPHTPPAGEALSTGERIQLPRPSAASVRAHCEPAVAVGDANLDPVQGDHLLGLVWVLAEAK